MGGRGYGGLDPLLAFNRRGGGRRPDQSLATNLPLSGVASCTGAAGSGIRDFYPLALEAREGSARRGLAKAGEGLAMIDDKKSCVL